VWRDKLPPQDADISKDEDEVDLALGLMSLEDLEEEFLTQPVVLEYAAEEGALEPTVVDEANGANPDDVKAIDDLFAEF